MPWDPKYNALGLSVVPDNLMAFWEANQADAFALFGGPDLPLIKNFAQSAAARSVPVWPSVAFISDSDAVDYTNGDLIVGAYAFRQELMVVGPEAEVVVAQAKIYTRALISMLLNCPLTTLLAGAGTIAPEAVINSTSAEFLEILTDEEQTQFMQRVQLETTIQVDASFLA